jgi:hypothetical protein
MRCSGRAVAKAALVAMALSVGAAAVQQEPARPNAANFGAAEITRALDVVKADPNLTSERTIKTLRWKRTATRPSHIPGWLAWIVGLFRWLDESARLLVWGAVVALAALLVAYIVRAVGRHGLPASRGEAFVAPTHVRDLDIRPESLPDDIGCAARALWDRGEHRPALALLYRGMLSRLAHVHRVPIRDSSTEGDCLAMAASHLPQGGREYASHLVRVWQRFVYAGQDTQSATVYVLCDEFGSALDLASPLDSLRPGGAA